jgi:hypothetical protein
MEFSPAKLCLVIPTSKSSPHYYSVRHPQYMESVIKYRNGVNRMLQSYMNVSCVILRELTCSWRLWGKQETANEDRRLGFPEHWLLIVKLWKRQIFWRMKTDNHATNEPPPPPLSYPLFTPCCAVLCVSLYALWRSKIMGSVSHCVIFAPQTLRQNEDAVWHTPLQQFL